MVEPIFHYPDSRFLPESLWGKNWVDLEDPTALEVGDWMFDHRTGSYYAAEITWIGDVAVEVTYHKSIDNIIPGCTVMKNKLTEYFWWADPALQEV